MKLLAFDVESNGLHGPAFAVAGLLLGSDGKITNEFAARCLIQGDTDDFVAREVLPQLVDLPESHNSPKAMRDSFWGWYTEAKKLADHIVLQNPYPVESRFLIACQEDDLATRYFEHPFPSMDISSMLLMIGAGTRDEREKIIKEAVADHEVTHHDPRYDAWATAAAALHALKIAGQLKS